MCAARNLSEMVWPDHIEFPIDGFAPNCLVKGMDPLRNLRQQLPTIKNFEEARS